MIHTALVVDDSRTARFMLAKILQRLGVVTATANSAEEALEYLAGHVPDAIFIDHVMPGIDGLHATQKIKADPRFAAVPIVIFTAKEGDEYIAQAKAHGAYSVLTKPPSDEFVQGLLDELAIVAVAAPPPVLEEQPTPAEVAAAPGLAEDEVERVARQVVDEAFGSHIEVRLAELIDERISTLREEVREQHEANVTRLSDLSGQARDAFNHDSATADHAKRIDALLEATVARVNTLQEEHDTAAQATAVAGERLEQVAADVTGITTRLDDAESLATRVDAFEQKQTDLAGRTAKLIEQTVEKTSRRYAQGVANFIRKDAAKVTEKLVEKHVARLRDELIAAQADAGRKSAPLLPTLLAVAALAAAAVALFLTLL